MSENKLLVQTVNDIINTVIKPYQGSLLVNLDFRYSNKKYVLRYSICEDFFSNSVLLDSCFRTTEELLLWFDFTDIITDFDIEIITPKYRNIETYYSLMKIIIGHSRTLISHPRNQKYQEYHARLQNETIEFDKTKNIFFPQKEKETFFGKLKKWVVSLWSKK
jgi:hypothetical protein